MVPIKNLSAILPFFVFIIILSCTPKHQEAGSDTPQKRNIQTIASGFEERRMKTLEKIIHADLPEEDADNIFVNNQVRALTILYHVTIPKKTLGFMSGKCLLKGLARN